MKKILISVLLISCSRPDEKFYFKKALRYEKKQEHALSIKNLAKVLEVGKDKNYLLEASRMATRIKHKNKLDEIKFLRTIILHTDDKKERKDAQKKVADLYYEAENYVRAIYEYELLSTQDLKLAQSYFYLDDFKQALVEVEVFEKAMGPNFETNLLKARIKVGILELDEAIKIYQSLLQNKSESKTQTVLIELSQCYEQQGDYSKAIEVLEGSEDKVVKARLSRLKVAKEMQPGAKRIAR